MSVYRPKNSPYYHFDFQWQGERYCGSTKCRSKTDARKYERDYQSQLATGTKQKPSIDLDEACGLYWDGKGRFDKSANTVEPQLANLIRIIGGNMLLHDMDRITLNNFTAKRRGEKARNKNTLVEPATVNREIELLRRVFRYVSARYRVAEIKWGEATLPEPRERVRYLSQAEDKSLMAAAVEYDPDIADLIEFACLSGGRKDAVRRLLWSNIDFAARQAKVHTKGDVWHTFPLSGRMIEILANRPKVGPYAFTYVCRKTRKALTDKKGRKHHARRKGERYPFSKNGWARHWYRILAKAGIENFRFHDLRHTAGTRITGSSNLKVAQRLLGHTRIETTARYAHIEDADILAAMENVEQSRNSPVVENRNLAETRRNARDRA